VAKERELGPPEFVREKGGTDAVSEFRLFSETVGEASAHLLAELAEIHNFGTEDDIPEEDHRATKVRGLCCRKLRDWAVFYTTSLKPFGIIVVHVASMNPRPFDELENEAERRLRRMRR
jgi:hypothetical protein